MASSTNAAPPTAGPAKTNKTEITSKQLRMDTDKKIANFDGDVLVNDPQFQMRSNRLVVYLNPNGSGMDRGEAFDDVVIVQESQKRKAYCQKAVYYAADGRMVLTGNPRLESDKGETRGDVITIYRSNKRISVEGNTSTTIDLSAPVSTNPPAADGAPTNTPPAESAQTNSAPPQTTN